MKLNRFSFLSCKASNKKTWGPAVRSQKYDEDLDILPKDKRLPKWCYYCGRSVGVKLMPCSRCKKICYCSNNCKQRAWNEFHKNECVLADSRKLFFCFNPFLLLFSFAVDFFLISLKYLFL